MGGRRSARESRRRASGSRRREDGGRCAGTNAGIDGGGLPEGEEEDDMWARGQNGLLNLHSDKNDYYTQRGVL